MTTVSEASIGRSALEALATEAPLVRARIDRIVGKRIGSARLAQVHFKDGGFMQLQFGTKGTHTMKLVHQLVYQLKRL